MYPLPKGSQLGRLSINEVYDYYDGPKLFTAKNSSGTTYLAFWADQDGAGDVWLYVPISNGRLQKVKTGEVSLRNTFIESEDGFAFKIHTSFDGSTNRVDCVLGKEIDDELLPLPDDRLSITKGRQRKKEKIAGYRQELRVVRGEQSPKLSTVTAIFDSWLSLVKAIASSGGYDLELYAEGARHGSFIIELSASDANASDFAVKKLKEFIEISDSTDDLLKLLSAESIDPSLLEGFIETTANNNCQIEVSTYRDESRSLDYFISLEQSVLSGLLPRVKGVSDSFLGTDKIPQADELDRIFVLLELASNFKQISSKSMGGITERQVSYYKHAAKVLRYLDERNCVTAAGSYVASLDKERRLITTANQFGTSDCGWAWLNWSKVSTLAQIDRSSAVEFLTSMAPGLSESTAKRRAVTLKSWVEELSPYHFGGQ